MPAQVVDRHKVLQILINLLSNAKYAMDEQAPVARNALKSTSTGCRGNTAITVRDIGIGITRQKISRAFAARLYHQKGRPTGSASTVAPSPPNK